MMDDLISRQAAIDRIESHIRTGDELYTLTDADKILNYAFEVAASCVYNLPSAQPEYTEQDMRDEFSAGYDCGMEAAQRKIVRCKDCKYWMPHSQLGYDEDNKTYHDYCEKLIPEDEYYAFYRDADDFCSYAERRTDEQADIR